MLRKVPLFAEFGPYLILFYFEQVGISFELKKSVCFPSLTQCVDRNQVTPGIAGDIEGIRYHNNGLNWRENAMICD